MWSPRCDRAGRDEPGTRPSRRPRRRAPRPVRARRRAAAISSASGSRPTCSLTGRPSSPTAATGKPTGQQAASVPTQIVRAERGWYSRPAAITSDCGGGGALPRPASRRPPRPVLPQPQWRLSASRSTGVFRGHRPCPSWSLASTTSCPPRSWSSHRWWGASFRRESWPSWGRGRGGRHRWRHHVDFSAGQVERNLVIGGRNVAFSAAEPSWAPVAVKVIAPVCPPAAGGTKSQVTDEGVLLQLVS